jgi:hypothetical protein
MRGLGSAERRDFSIFDQDVIKRKENLAVDRRPVVGIGGNHQDVAVETPSPARSPRGYAGDTSKRHGQESDAGGSTSTHLDRLLGFVVPVVAVLEAQPVPMDRNLEVTVVDDVDPDLCPLVHLEGWAGIEPL